MATPDKTGIQTVSGGWFDLLNNKQDKIATTNATPYAAKTWGLMRPQSTALFEVDAVAHCPSSGDAASYKRRATFYRQATGGVAQIGSTTDAETQETAGASDWDVRISTNGGSVSVYLVGGSAPVSWTVKVRLLLRRLDG